MTKSSRKSVGQDDITFQRESCFPVRFHTAPRWLTDPISGLVHDDVVKGITILQMYSYVYVKLRRWYGNGSCGVVTETENQNISRKRKQMLWSWWEGK